MDGWKHKVDLNAILTSYKGDEDFDRVKNELLQKMEEHEGLFADNPKLLKKLRAAKDPDIFDDALDDLYDYCDEQGIFLGE